MFRPKIQDTKILMIMAFIAILSVMWVSKSFEYIQSDDIIDNNAFHDFYLSEELTPTLIKDKKSNNTILGVLRKG